MFPPNAGRMAKLQILPFLPTLLLPNDLFGHDVIGRHVSSARSLPLFSEILFRVLGQAKRRHACQRIREALCKTFQNDTLTDM